MIDLNLFRIRSFNVALLINFLAIFVAVGYFLFVAQYLQLILGLSPLEAGLWSLPSAIAFIVGSQAAPHIVRRVRPAYLIGGGLGLGAVGLVVLTQVGTTGGLPALVAASIIISLGMAPVFGLTTEMIVGSAPPERAGAASGISETGAELGGALGYRPAGQHRRRHLPLAAGERAAGVSAARGGSRSQRHARQRDGGCRAAPRAAGSGGDRDRAAGVRGRHADQFGDRRGGGDRTGRAGGRGPS